MSTEEKELANNCLDLIKKDREEGATVVDLKGLFIKLRKHLGQSEKSSEEMWERGQKG